MYNVVPITRRIYLHISRHYTCANFNRARIGDKILSRGRTFDVAPLDMVELCVPGVPFNWLRASRHAPENAIFVEFEQCLAWAFIDLPSQARNAPICAPGKKRERERALTFSLPLRVPPSPKSQGKRAIPAKFAGGSFDLWRKFLVAALLRWNFVKLLLALFSIPSHSRVLARFFFFAHRRKPLPPPSFLTLNPSFDRAPSGWEIAGGPAFWHRRSTGLIDFLRPRLSTPKIAPLRSNTLIMAMCPPMKHEAS